MRHHAVSTVLQKPYFWRSPQLRGVLYSMQGSCILCNKRRCVRRGLKVLASQRVQRYAEKKHFIFNLPYPVITGNYNMSYSRLQKNPTFQTSHAFNSQIVHAGVVEEGNLLNNVIRGGFIWKRRRQTEGCQPLYRRLSATGLQPDKDLEQE